MKTILLFAVLHLLALAGGNHPDSKDPLPLLQGVFVFNRVLKKENAVFLSFFDLNHKEIYFDAVKCELRPFIFYQTTDGVVQTNDKLKGARFFVSYKKSNPKTAGFYIVKLKKIDP